MKIHLKKDTGETIAISPDIKISDKQAEILHEYASNAWEEIPEAELFENELVLWIDSSVGITNFAKYPYELGLYIDICIPHIKTW